MLKKKLMGLLILCAIPILNRKYYVNIFVVLIDREHLPEDMTKTIKRYIPQFSIQQQSKHIIQIKFYPTKEKEVTILIAINGTTTNLEEDRSKFILYRFGDTIPPNKHSIKRYYKEKQLNELEEIKKADPNTIEKAFLGITNAFKLLEKLIRKRKSK